MKYTFDLLGVSPIVHFFNQQQELTQQKPTRRVEYVGTHTCTLDSFIQSVETVSPKRGWDVDDVVQTVIQFWMNNADKVHYWQERLQDAGQENLLVARVGDIKALKATFEAILEKKA